MSNYPLWLQSDIIAASTAEGWQERREKTLAALKKIKDTARTDPLIEVVYGLAVQLALMDDEAAEMRRKARALDDRIFFTKARVDGLWEDLKEMRDGAPAEEGDDDPLLERLAALEHDQWAHWTRYLLANMTRENVERWRRQIETPYAELSEKEKESDREWARKVVQIVRASAEPEKTITNPVTGTTYPVANRSEKRSGKQTKGLWGVDDEP